MNWWKLLKTALGVMGGVNYSEPLEVVNALPVVMKRRLSMDKKLEFKNAFPLWEKLGFDPYIPYAQAWDEAAGFSRVIGDYNFWGMKKPRVWDGKIIYGVPTHENLGAARVAVRDNFIDFLSIEEAVCFYYTQIYRLYPQAYICRKDYKAFFIGLMSNPEIQWCNNNEYVEDLIRIYEQIKANNY